MTLYELDDYFNSFLKKEDYSGDISLNGIQVQNSSPSKKDITKVAFAVDACHGTIEKAIAAGAGVLFVHHGLFWGKCETITGVMYRRIALCIEHDLAIYASHVPLDANMEVGNNIGLARRIGLGDISPFGLWRGMTIGLMGVLPQSLPIEEVAHRLLPHGERPLMILGAGECRKVGIISGGASSDVVQAVDKRLDLYITGDVQHEIYNTIVESGINFIAGGHYNTETLGVTQVAQKLAQEKGIETLFIDNPTGL